MVKGYSGADRALDYLFSHATEVAAAQIVSSGTPVATITIDGTALTLYVPSFSVSYTQVYEGGTKIGTIVINGTAVDVYAPTPKEITVSNGIVSLT